MKNMFFNFPDRYTNFIFNNNNICNLQFMFCIAILSIKVLLKGALREIDQLIYLSSLLKLSLTKIA